MTLPADIRGDFPSLGVAAHGRAVAYLDSAASAQKPRAVIDVMAAAMAGPYANVHRGLYDFGSRTSAAFEEARAKVAGFLNAAGPSEIVFTRNATEAINLVASSFGASLREGDEVVLTALEHHANIVPWYFLAKTRGVVIRVAPILADGSLDLEAYARLLGPRTKIVAFTQMSNAIGTVTPVAEMIRLARAVGAATLIDGSQGAVHLGADVTALGCDFYVFTGHKLYGPTGIGVLYGRAARLAEMPPWQGGGEMVERVDFDHITFKDAPARFEAGTPPIVEAIGLGAAIDYIAARLPRAAVAAHEATLLQAAEAALKSIPGVSIQSQARERAAILSFTLQGIHPHDAATVFDRMGLCLRAGHHCAQPLMKVLGVPATVRASFAPYNTLDDVARLAEGVEKARSLLS